MAGRAANEKISTNKYKGGGSPEGGAFWSLLASSEICFLTVNASELTAD